MARRRNPGRRRRKITSQAQWRKLATLVRSRRMSKRDFDDMVDASRPYSRLPKHAPRRRKKKTMARRRRKRNASGYNYIRNLPYHPTSWPPKRPRTFNRAASIETNLGKDERALLRKTDRDSGLSDGSRAVLTAHARRIAQKLHRRGLLKKTGRTGKNARYTVTTKGYDSLRFARAKPRRRRR